MERGTRRVVIGTAVVVGALVASIPFLGLLAVLFGAMIADCALLGILFVPRVRVGTLRAPPEQALAYLSHRLRVARYRLAATPGELKVWVGRGALVHLRIAGKGEGSELTWKAYATPGGWGTVMTLIILAWTAIAAIPLLLYLYFRAAAFVRDRLTPILPPDGAIPASFRQDDIGVLLVAGLAEGHRLAKEAYELERNTYQDNVGIALLVALLAGFLVFGWQIAYSPEPDFDLRVRNALLVATGGGAALAVVLAWIVRWRFRPRLLRFREWSNRLQVALERETQREVPGAETPSTFEILSSATREVPGWLDATRRAGLGADFGMWSLVFVLAMGAIELLVFSVALALSGVQLYFAALLFVGGVGLSALAYVMSKRWEQRRDRQLGAEMTNWQGRLEAVRSRMEQFLKDL